MVGLYFIITGSGGQPVTPQDPFADNGLNLTAAQKAEIIRNLDLLENYKDLSSENLKTEDIPGLAKEEFVVVEELADRGVYPNFSETSSTNETGTDE